MAGHKHLKEKTMKMVLGLLAVAILLALAASVEALDCTPGTVTSLQPGCGTTIINKANASATGGTAIVGPINNTATGGAATGGNNDGVSVSIDVPRQAPPAIPAGLAVSSLTCFGSWSIAASTPFGGVGAGFPTKDEDCERARNAVIFAQVLGMPDVALALMAQNESNMKALKAAGKKIPGQTAEFQTTPKVVSGALQITPVASLATPTFVAANAIAVSTQPNRDESLVQCGARTKVRAGNGEWFCWE